MSVPFISFQDCDPLLDWFELTNAMADGHDLPKAEIGDTFLYRGKDTLLSRAAWIDGLGMAVKTATIFPGNPEAGKPMVNGAVCLYSDTDGTLAALIDFHLITKWKTAGDSLLGALKLARRDSRSILIVGAGTVGRSLCDAFGAGFPDAQIAIWNRTQSKAQALADTLPGVTIADDLETAVRSADIIVSATMATDPFIRGDWLRPGQHLNLIGAYRPDMRETDDIALQRAKVYVDSFETTIGHIGEINIPLTTGAITRDDLQADYYDLAAFKRGSDDDITIFKNGGGAHLDLMTCRYVLGKWQSAI
ncbi:MAG: ornithine cyclodeaminase/alanine dehydrogenase-like protein (mu-crystallin family) [Paracoccaceae bacterium]|jgi:ornithine cyclodeaminase/alanine dehydrogenase-like protein (mu-crystallin family)